MEGSGMMTGTKDSDISDMAAEPKASVVRLDGQTEEVGHLVTALEQIAADLSWQPGQQLREYQAQAVHFAAYADGVLAGGMQLVPATLSQTLPCELVWPEVTLPRRDRTAHIAIMALRPEHRGTAGLLWPLCIAMWRYCAAHSLTDISLEVTPDLYRLYRRLGWPLEIVGSLRPHWGEDTCYLCRMGVAEVAGEMMIRATQASTYRSIVSLMSLPCEKPGSRPPAVLQPSVLQPGNCCETVV